MSDSFRTEITEMEVAAQHVREVNQHIQQNLRTMLSRLEALYATWHGAAAGSFHGLKERWHANATELNDTLYAIAEALDRSKENYARTDDVNRTGFSGIAGKL